MPDMDRINAMDAPEFVQMFGALFENAPWVAERAWPARPFATPHALHTAMVNVVKIAALPQQLQLLQNHPDLAGTEAQTGTMTPASIAEQTTAGLNALSKEELAQITSYNAAYKQKFGFPFIIPVRMHTKAGILFDFGRRLHNDTQTEFGAALQSVYAISLLRLMALLELGS